MMRLLPCRLAAADLLHARVATLCQIVGLAALLVPLLVIFGIKNGIVADRTTALLNNPENLRISISGQQIYSADFIENLAANPEVRFVSPQPMNLALLADFARPVDGGEIVPKVTLLATGVGDPYLADSAKIPEPGQVVLTAVTAGLLGGAVIGDQIDAILAPRDGEPEGALMSLLVADVLPAGVWGRTGALMSPLDVFLIQDWMHGTLSGEYLDTLRAPYDFPTTYPLIRLYATDVDSAFRLVQKLADQGISSGASLGEARELVLLRDALNAGFVTVALVGLVGVTATFSASLWGAVNRNRRPLGLLRLGGLDRRSALLMPVAQAFLIGLAGWILALVIYLSLTGILDFFLADTFGVDQQLARVTGAEVTMSGLATVIVSILAAIGAAISATSITPEEAFLDGH